jgi:hypothetical protein
MERPQAAPPATRYLQQGEHDVRDHDAADSNVALEPSRRIDAHECLRRLDTSDDECATVFLAARCV